MNSSFFPWRIFRKFFFASIVLLCVAQVSALGIASYVFDFPFYSRDSIVFLFSFFGVTVVASSLFAGYLALPLRDLILKALRLSAKKYVQEFEEDDVVIEDPGPFVEMEQALDKIRRKLQRRRLQLSHEREESQALMRSMDDSIVSIDLDEKIVFYNAKFAAQFLNELDLSKNPTPSLALCFRQPEILSLFTEAIKKGLTGSCQLQVYSQLINRAGYYLLRVSPLREEKSLEIYGAMGVFHDITDMKKAELMRVEFVENASHELRTPLTAIKGYLATIRDDLNSGRREQISDFLMIAIRNVDRLTELVNDMLTISALESRPALKLARINPMVLTEEVLARLSSLALEKNITITASSDSPEVFVDVAKIEQVLTNLVSNAIKYIPENGRVDLRWTQKDSELVILSVKDNGPGIPHEHQGRLFERFYRVDKGRSRDVGGTGLGLSIVKHIVQTHGGNVSLVSSVGQGAEFICEFPQNLET